MAARTAHDDGFDGAAAVTRSLLGWGVVVGPFYLLIGVILGLTSPGFDFSRHQLSLLMLGELGWVQMVNLILSGLMVIAAGIGFSRALRGTRAASWGASLVCLYGACLVASGIFSPDPMAGFPAGSSPEGTAVAGTMSGLLHLAFGALGFLSLAVAAIIVGGWFARRGERTWATVSRLAGIVVIAGFIGGAALSSQVLGVVLLWIAVVAGFAWLLAASVRIYRTVPHPDAKRRTSEASGASRPVADI